MSKLTTLLKRLSKQQSFTVLKLSSLVAVLWGKNTCFVVFVKKFTALLNGYLPVPDVNEYIVTPAVSGNGSATLGNFALAKDVADKHANK